MDDLIPEFQRLEDEIAAAFAAADADGVASHYTEDAALMIPFRPAIEGREAIAEFYRGVFAQGGVRVATQVLEAHVAGEWAYLRGKLDQTFTPHKGRPLDSRGKYLVIARREPGPDGEAMWRFHRDIFNGDQPPQIANGCLALLAAPLQRLFAGS